MNVTWRGKTYVGTLLDCTKNDWASPRFCDSPTSDLEMRTPKNRGKRGRTQTATPVSDPGASDNPKSATKLRNGAKGRRGSSANAAFVAPVSPMKPEFPKRKTRGSETESQEDSSSTASKNMKRFKLTKESTGRQSNSPAPSTPLAGNSESSSGPFSPALIECPEPNCSKKYKHINGLRYHQSHAHSTNFVPEDSDSNMSSASTTNINSTHETLGPSIESSGRIGESQLDDDIAEGSQSGPEGSSAPTTPIKRDVVKLESDNKDIEFDALDCDLNVTNDVELDVGLPFSSKLLTSKNEEKVDSERDFENAEICLGTKEIKVSTSSLGRTPILTVPTFMSLQNRGTSLGLASSLHRMTQDTPDPKLSRDQEAASNMLGIVGSANPLSANVPKSGVPWQPHAHSQATSSHGHAAHVISSLHPQPNLNIPNPLGISLGSNSTTPDLEKGNKDGGSGSIGTGSKKPKHKKKKDKSDRDRERDRDGKSRLSDSGRDLTRGLFSGSSGSGSSSSGGKGKDRDERKSLKGTTGEDMSSSRRDSDSGGGNSGENRDDPQSPAYSDISDANDSGPELDLKLKEPPSKVIPVVPDLKKDNPNAGLAAGQNMSSFYSPFYSPHSLDSPYTNPNGNGAPGGQVKSERVSGAGSAMDEQSTDKLKSKPTPPLPQHLQGHSDERRSPKMDYHAKYLPPQQHYYPYPYANYHYDQSPYGLIPEHPYNSHRGMMEEKERETFDEQRGRINMKGRSSTESNKDESGSFSSNISTSVKQEPHSDRDRPSKASRLHPGCGGE